MDLANLKTEFRRCLIAWRAYEKDLIKRGLNGPLQPTAVGWKVADAREMQKVTSELLPLSHQLHIGTVDERLIGSYVLHEPLDESGVKIIKVLQRRPGSEDPLGLDHIDFYVPDIAKAKNILAEVRANWEAQRNEVHEWLSVRFGEVLEYEAKLVDHIVLDATIKELENARSAIIDKMT